MRRTDAIATTRERLPVPLPATDAAPAGLVAYALTLVGAALAAILVVTVAYPILPTVSIDRASSSGAAIAVGIAFWIVFGFAGSVRPRNVVGGAVITFHMPFVIAGTILGGPLVGALMGVISLTELREIRRGPWYGVLANHATCVLAAVVAGVVGHAVDAAAGDLLPASDAIHTLAIGVVVAGTFVAMNLVLVLPVVALRSGAEWGSVVRRATTALRATLVAEVTLGWLMAVTYLSVAWWAPLVCVLVILAVWDAHARHEELRHDPMTGLLNDAGVEPLLEAAVDESRRHRRRHALLFIDLDGFGKLNKAHGEDVGDEVIKAVAGRLAAAVRGSDAVARQNRAGDEFVLLFRDLPDDEMATRLAWRVHDSIRRPVRVRGASLEVEVGASIGIAMLAPGGTESLDHLKRVADERMQTIKRAGGGVLPPPDPGPPG
jgi:diguanylate cyclase (GGDEF)-like protein